MVELKLYILNYDNEDYYDNERYQQIVFAESKGDAIRYLKDSISDSKIAEGLVLKEKHKLPKGYNYMWTHPMVDGEFGCYSDKINIVVERFKILTPICYFISKINTNPVELVEHIIQKGSVINTI